MEYGLIMYKDTANLGDDIQTYAVSQFMPRVDYVIDREELDSFHTSSGNPVAVIMAGWYLFNHLNWPPSPYIIPLTTSMHFSLTNMFLGASMMKNFVLEDYGAEWLIRNGPVGSRDKSTKEALLSFGIPSYFSGCITLTLKKYAEVESHGNICTVDIAPQAYEKVLKSTNMPVMNLSHNISVSTLDFDLRMKIVEERLKIYQGASLVVTSRLHAALPCLALGTPVLFLKENWDINHPRIETFLPYLNHMDLEDFLSEEAKYDFNNPLVNPLDYSSDMFEMREKLQLDCEVFIQKYECEKNLPYYDPIMFKDFVLRMNRLKKLMRLRIDKFKRMPK